jgi:tetratricopeptide (TPR) repeat protein
MAQRIAPKLLIVGWDAADWKLIDAFIPQGWMPNLKAFLDRGVRGDLSSLDPKLSPLLWTSIATGKTADKHGILNFVEPEPSGTGLRVSCSTTRRVKALWNILTQAGLRTNAVGWYASHPAEPIAGAMVSNLFQEGTPPESHAPWPLLPGAVHPAALQDRIAGLRLHPGEIGPDDLRALVPDLARLNAGDPRAHLLGKLLAQCASVHNVATALIADQRPWDCAMVFYETIDVVGHHFMQYYPPRMAHLSSGDFEMFRHVMAGVYRLQDAMLGRLLQLAGDDTTVILLSDHGFHSDHLRPRVQASLHDAHAAMDASWHRPLGILAMAGPGIKRGETVYGANLLDIAPTALTLLGQPVGADMDGRVLVEAIDRPVEIERVFSWDDLAGEAGQHPPDLRIDPFESRAAMAQLADLGYISAPTGSEQSDLALCDRETRFNLGVVYMTTSRQSAALEVFDRLHAEHPLDPRFAMNLAYCLSSLGEHVRAAAILERLVREQPHVPDAKLMHGSALFALGRVEEAAAQLDAALRQSPDRPDLLCAMGDACTHLKRYDEARTLLERAAAIDPHDPAAQHKLAQLAVAQERFEDAVDHALRALELRHFFPDAHYTLGVALTWMKDYEHAIQSFKVAVSMQPGMVQALRFIASIYRHLDDRRSARPFREQAERLLAARAQGEMAPEALLRETPMGPQEWARRMGQDD